MWFSVMREDVTDISVFIMKSNAHLSSYSGRNEMVIALLPKMNIETGADYQQKFRVETCS